MRQERNAWELDAEIHEMELDRSYRELPARMAYWGGRYADAYEAFRRAENNRELVFAQVCMELREQMRDNGLKPTDTAVKEATLRDPRVQDAIMEEIDAEASKERMRAACEAMRTKKDMLVSLGAHVRAQMDAVPFTRQEQANEWRARQLESTAGSSQNLDHEERTDEQHTPTTKSPSRPRSPSAPGTGSATSAAPRRAPPRAAGR